VRTPPVATIPLALDGSRHRAGATIVRAYKIPEATMRIVCWALVMLIAGCAEDEFPSRPGPMRGVELSTVEAPPTCRPIEAVEVRSGHHDPTSHEMLSAHALERGANYVVLDAFAVVANSNDIYAVTRARLFQCPIALVCYRCPARQ
jgi:hypothetical protein